MKKLLIILITIALLIPINTKAWYCEYKTLSNLKTLASNITYTYSYELINNEPIFKITLSNIPKNVYIINSASESNYYPVKDMDQVTFSNYKPGKSYQFIVRTNEEFCETQEVSRIYVPIPSYNKYYSDPLCLEFPDHNLCSRWANVNMSYEEFKNKMVFFKQEEALKNIEAKKESNKLIEWYINNYYLLLPTIIIICIGYIYNIKQKDTFDF